MFRLFLMKKLASSAKKTPAPQLPSKQYRNRRLYERFNIDYRHISLLNEQDILLIRDLSTTGFSCEVGTRCFERLKLGDTYLCRIRYLKEIYELTVKVMWKSETFVGFSIEESNAQIQNFIERVLTPARIGFSLNPIDSTLRKHIFDDSPLRFHGEDQSRLLIWESHNQELESWHFEYKNSYLQWDQYKGLETGQLLKKDKAPLSEVWNKTKKKDDTLNTNFRQFTTDMLMTLKFPRSQNLIDSLNSTYTAPTDSILTLTL